MKYLHGENRKYMINLQRWRSLAALVACCITIGACYYAVGHSFFIYISEGAKIREYFRYYTTISNLLTLFASFFTVPYAISGYRKKRFIMPKWLCIMFYAGVVSISLTIVFVFTCISWYDPQFAFTGSNFYLHIVCPAAVLISFSLIETPYRYT